MATATTSKSRAAQARARLKKAVHELTTWLRFMGEIRSLRPMYLRERAADLRTARKLLAIAEAHYANARRLNPRRR